MKINNIFNPAMTLMGKLTYPKKIALIGIISLLATSLLSFTLSIQQKVIIQAHLQLEGIEEIVALNRVVQLAQQYRGLSAATFSGDISLLKQHTLKEQETEDALNLALVSLNPDVTLKGVEHLKQLLQTIKEEHDSVSLEDDFAKHSFFIAQVQLLAKLVAEYHQLLTTNSLTSYYLVDNLVNSIPESIEYMGQIRAIVTGVLSNKVLSPLQRDQLIRLESLVERSFGQFEFNTSAIKRSSPDMAALIDKSYQDFLSNKNRQLKLVHDDVLTGNFTHPPALFFRDRTDAIDKIYSLMNHSLVPRLQTYINKRVNTAETMLLNTIGFSVGLLLIILYLLVGLYKSVLKNINHISQTVDEYAQGDFDTRIKLETFDEMREISISVNAMADGANKARAEIEKERKRLNSIIDDAMDGLVQMNDQGVIVGWNRQAEHIFGWTKEQAIGNELYSIILPDKYQKQHSADFKKSLKLGQLRKFGIATEVTAINAKGIEFPIEISISMLQHNGQIEFTAFIRDLTQLKKDKQDLVKSEESLKNAQMVAHLGSWDLDIINNELTWSEEVYRIFEYDTTLDPSYNYYLNTIHKDDRDRVHKSYLDSVERKTEYSIEHRMMMKDGRVKYILKQGKSEYSEQGEAIRSYGSVLDITERKEYELKLIQLKMDADKANRTKSKFLANMSHELRTPMHGILSFSSFGIKKIDTVERRKLGEYFFNIQVSGQRLLVLLNDLLDLSKIESGKIKLNIKEGDLGAVFNSCYIEQQQRIKDSNLTININISSPVIGQFDSDRIGQVITNLFSNSIKFTPEGGIITVTIENRNDELSFILQDQGVGIPEGELEDVFDAFIQSSKTDTGAGGTGLGLAICKNIIDQHNGKIWSENHPNGGALFQFSIPSKQD